MENLNEKIMEKTVEENVKEEIMEKMAEINKFKYDFVFFIEVVMGDPNGDPDNMGYPRMLDEIGIITNGCLKRHVRDYVDDVMFGEPGYDIFIKRDIPLERNINKFLDSYGLTTNSKSKDFAAMKKKLEGSEEDIDLAIAKYMGENYFDVRVMGEAFSSLMGKLDYGQVKGQMQMGNAMSVSKIKLVDLAFTRCAPFKEGGEKVIANKQVVKYGLYRCKGSICPNVGRKNVPMTEKDIQLIWQAILNMFEFNISSQTGETTTRKLIIFKHNSPYGNARWSKLNDRIKIEQVGGDDDGYPTCYEDFKITVDTDNLPKGVSCEILE